MVINHPVLNRFSPSIKEVMPEVGDDRILIRNLFSLTGLPPEPVQIQGGGINNPQDGSFANGTSFTIANAAASSVTLAFLRNGYWRIRVTGCYIANYVSILQGGDLQINLSTPSQIFQMGTLYAGNNVQQFDFEIEVMLPTISVAPFAHTVSVTLNTNGVGNSHAVSAHILGNKLL